MAEKANKSASVKSSASICSGANLSDSSPKSNADLIQVFSRFEAFNFDGDHQFQAGLDRIINGTKAVDLLKLKAFYYSRNVEPMDLAAYVDWRKKYGECEDHISSTDHGSTQDEGSSPDQLTTTHSEGPDSDSQSPANDTQAGTGSRKICKISKAGPCEDGNVKDPQHPGDAQNNGMSHSEGGGESCTTLLSHQESSTYPAETQITIIDRKMRASSIAGNSGEEGNQTIQKVKQIGSKDTSMTCTSRPLDQISDQRVEHTGIDAISTNLSHTNVDQISDSSVEQTGKDTVCTDLSHSSTDHNCDSRVEQMGKDTVCTDLSHADTDKKHDSSVEQTGKDTDLSYTSKDQNPDPEILKQDDTQVDNDNNEQSSVSVHDVSSKAVADSMGRHEELSFAEIAELIQSGKPIPGLAQFEVVPTNVAPTPSRLHRVKKPWEQ